MLAHGAVYGDIFRVHALGFFDQGLFDLLNWTYSSGLEFFLHSANRPKKIDRSRPSFPDNVTNFVELALQFARSLGFGILYSEGNTHRGCDPNGRRAAHHHIADHL